MYSSVYRKKSASNAWQGGRLCWLVSLAVLSAGVSGEVLRDPTRPQGRSPVVPLDDIETREEVRWVLGQVLVSESRRIAVVNGQVVGEGDDVAGATVLAIRPDRVEMLYDGTRMALAIARYPAVSIQSRQAAD